MTSSPCAPRSAAGASPGRALPRRQPVPAGPAWLTASRRARPRPGLWLAAAAPDDLVAVTGTKGKSTVTAMTAPPAARGRPRGRLAGNIGVALTTVDASRAARRPRRRAVELPARRPRAPRPAVAAGVTTLFVDHVPWHGSIARYHADKVRLLGMAEWRVVGPQVASAHRSRPDASTPSPATRRRQVTAALAQCRAARCPRGSGRDARPRPRRAAARP
jgi:UDP-N-acetylmuramoylalanine-D-glutamate ligase